MNMHSRMAIRSQLLLVVCEVWVRFHVVLCVVSTRPSRYSGMDRGGSVGDCDCRIVLGEVMNSDSTFQSVLRVEREAKLQALGDCLNTCGGYYSFFIELLCRGEDLPRQVCPGLACGSDDVEHGSHCSILPVRQARVPRTGVGVVGVYHMIQQGDADDFPRLDKLLCDVDVLFAWLCITRRMVVRDHD